MTSIALNGFLTGLLLQIAIGPVFFFILNLSLRRTMADGLSAVAAVTLVDYLFIALAVMGVGKLLERPKIRFATGTISSMVLILFGMVMMLSMAPASGVPDPGDGLESDIVASFAAAFLLTISSPLTIVFWTSLFAAKAIEKGYAKNQLIVFGIAAGLATLVFLGASVTLLSMIRTSIPETLLRISNLAVGALLIVYGGVRLKRMVAPGSRCV
jgi:threonine/homoserine/homoserine lactone efflux protein